MRALSSGHLKAARNNEGDWQIEPEALEDWMSMRRSHDRQSPGTTTEPPPVTPSVTYSDTPETLAKLAAAETEARMLREQIADLKIDRNALREALSRAAIGAQAPQNRLGFFARLLGQR